MSCEMGGERDAPPGLGLRKFLWSILECVAEASALAVLVSNAAALVGIAVEMQD